ncbi:hypothetical protein V8C26DRAFT_238901 [Trichoderma gracile]
MRFRIAPHRTASRASPVLFVCLLAPEPKRAPALLRHKTPRTTRDTLPNRQPSLAASESSPGPGEPEGMPAAGQCRAPTRPLLGPSGAKPRMKPWRMQDIDSLCQPGRLTPSVDPAILWVAPAIRIHGFYAPTGRSPLRPSLSPWRPCWLTTVAAQPPLAGPSLSSPLVEVSSSFLWALAAGADAEKRNKGGTRQDKTDTRPHTRRRTRANPSADDGSSQSLSMARSGELRYCRCKVVFTSSPGPPI